MKINGVDIAAITKINSVSKASITKMSGVTFATPSPIPTGVITTDLVMYLDAAVSAKVTPDILVIDVLFIPFILLTAAISTPFIFITYNSIQVLSGLKYTIHLPLVCTEFAQNKLPIILTTFPAADG